MKVKDLDCNDCLYSNKEGCSGNVIRCEYPLPNAITTGALFTSPYMGIRCPLLKTKADLAKLTNNEDRV